MRNNYTKEKVILGLLMVSLLIFSLFIIMLGDRAFGLAQDEGKKTVTQGEFAKELGERMELGAPLGAPVGEYFKALEARGIAPSEGWKAERPVTTQDLKEVLIEAGRLQAEVTPDKDVEEVLRERGIIMPGEVNKRVVDDLFKDKAVSELLNAPDAAISGPIIPNPLGDLKAIGTQPQYVSPPEIEVPPTTEPPPTEPPPTEPPPPPTTEPPRPSGGGAQ